jgi:hypothetical protein
MPLDEPHVNLWKTAEVSYRQILGNSTRYLRSASTLPVIFSDPIWCSTARDATSNFNLQGFHYVYQCH